MFDIAGKGYYHPFSQVNDPFPGNLAYTWNAKAQNIPFFRSFRSFAVNPNMQSPSNKLP